jgi:hypothetical protein
VADIGADALSSRTEGTDGVGHPEIDLPCVRLSGNGVGGGEASLFAEDLGRC